MKNILRLSSFIFVSLSLLSSCGATTSNAPSTVISNQTQEKTSDFTNDQKPDSGETSDFCPIHDINFHAISSDWVTYVGGDAYSTWLESKLADAKTEKDGQNIPCGGVGITDFILSFEIPKDVFLQIERPPLSDETIAFYAERGEIMTDEIFYNRYSYTDQQIDAFYSNDTVQIAQAICGDLGLVNPQTGELYSIYWLAEHSSEEYIEAGLPLEEVKTVIEKAASEEFGLTELAEAAQSKLTHVLSLASEAAPAK